MGIFRIAKAEFIKLFKKPSIYIMALVLLVTILFSTMFFKPSKVANYKVTDLGGSVNEIYTTYHDGDGTDSKSAYQSNVYTAWGEIYFYENNNKRAQSLALDWSALSDAYFIYADAVENERGNSNKLALVKNSFVLALSDFKTTLGNFNYTSKMNYSNFDLYSKYLTSSIYLADIAKIDAFSAQSGSNSIAYFNYLTSNNFLDTMEKMAHDHEDFVGVTLQSYAKNCKERYDAFETHLSYGTTTNVIVQNLINAINNLEDYYKLLFDISPLLEKGQTSEKVPVILVGKKKYQSYVESLDKYKQTLETSTELQEVNNTIKKNGYITNINNLVNDYELVRIDDKELTSLSSYLEKYVTPQMNSIISDKDGSIKKLFDDTAASDSIKDTQNILTEISKAKSISNNAKEYVTHRLMINIVSGKNDAQIQSLNAFNFDKYNTYEYQEEAARLNYLLTNNKYNYEYGYAFADGQTSGTSTNAFDFVYYALKWAVMLVSIYSIAMACSSIATEQENGTIKLLLIRPYKRFKIIIGKFLSIMSFAFLFMLFSFLVSFFVGYGLYGVSFQTVLTVFNGTSAFTISPLLLIFIDFILCFCEVLVFVFIAVMFATIFKTFATSFSVTLIVYALIIFANILFGSTYVFGLLPFANFNLFKFFGGAFRAGEVSGINTLFATHLIGVTNLVWALLYNVAITVITTLITCIVFRRRDF